MGISAAMITRLRSAKTGNVQNDPVPIHYEHHPELTLTMKTMTWGERLFANALCFPGK